MKQTKTPTKITTNKNHVKKLTVLFIAICASVSLWGQTEANVPISVGFVEAAEREGAAKIAAAEKKTEEAKKYHEAYRAAKAAGNDEEAARIYSEYKEWKAANAAAEQTGN